MKKISLAILLAMSIVSAKVDPFTGVDRTSTSVMRKASVHRSEKNGITDYRLMLSIHGITLTTNGKGAYVTFEDGTTWVRENAKVNVRYSSGYVYTALVMLDSDELELFKSKTIKTITLYVYDAKMGRVSANGFRKELAELN